MKKQRAFSKIPSIFEHRGRNSSAIESNYQEVHLTDLSGKTAYKVYETQGTHTLKEGRFVIGRLVPFLDGFMFYTESIVSFANVSPEWMQQAADIPIPQLTFVQRYRQDQELRRNN